MWMLNKVEVGQRLREQREQRHINARQFAMGAKVDQSQYLKIEKGIQRLTEKVLAKLVNQYQVDREYILYGNNSPFPSQVQEDPALYQLPVKEQLEKQDALLSVLVNELATIKSGTTGDHPEVIVKKIYKAADDLVKINRGEE